MSKFRKLLGDILYHENSKRVRTKGLLKSLEWDVACGVLVGVYSLISDIFLIMRAALYHEYKSTYHP